jgi:phosphohistidine phosphatase
MDLYILRHGIAEERSSHHKNDGDRQLTKQGRVQIEQLAKEMHLSFDLVLSSPLARAVQTAQAFGCKPIETENLGADMDPRELIDELNASRKNSILLVGHQPHLSALISVLVCGNEGCSFALKRGGFCKLIVDKLMYGQCATLELLRNNDV